MGAIDRDALREMCRSIPPGRWTTYGDLADALGLAGGARAVARVMADDHTMPNAHRVILSSGRISPGWGVAGGDGPEVARRRLEGEGVVFSGGAVADRARRWAPRGAA